jgi:hypothetical protein
VTLAQPKIDATSTIGFLRSLVGRDGGGGMMNVNGEDSNPFWWRFVLLVVLVLSTAAINVVLITNPLDLALALVALASLILVVAGGYWLFLSAALPSEREDVKQPAAPAMAPSSNLNRSIAIGAVATINILFILAAALVATRIVADGPRQSVVVRTPSGGQLVYRVWGDGPGPCEGATETGRSWTPVDPRIYGWDGYRVVAGLPDECNGGQHLTIGRLRSGTSIMITWASGVSAGPQSAFCPYPGGLVEYRLDNVNTQVTLLQGVELDPDFGGKPKACPGEG